MTMVQVAGLVLLSSIFLTVLSLAMRANAGDIPYLFHEWRLGLRAFVAMFVVVPVTATGIAIAFDLLPSVEVAIVALAFSPIPPLLPKKQLQAGASACYVTGLLVFAAVMSLLIAPTGIALAGRVFGVDADVAALEMAKKVAFTIAVPLSLGLMFQYRFPRLAAKYAATIEAGAGALLVASGLTLIVILAPAVWKLVGNGTVLALAAVIATGFGAGYLLSANNPENRAALSLAAGSRHPGVAIAVVGSAYPDARQAPAAIILFFILNALLSIPLLRRLSE